MYKVAALVYKAKIGDGHVVDDAINIWTALFNIPLPSWKVWRKDTWSAWWREIKQWWRDAFSHIELWISNGNGRFACCMLNEAEDGCGICGNKLGKGINDKELYGECYTSTMRGDWDGTVLRPASEVIKDPSRWDVGVIATITEDQYRRGMKEINHAVKYNQGYDKRCIADFFNPLRRWLPIHSKVKQICSEAFQHGLSALVSRFVWKYINSPRRIVRKLKKKGVVFTPVTEM